MRRAALACAACLAATGLAGSAQAGEPPWVELAKRYALDAINLDQFGSVSALDGSTLVVSAPERGVGVAYVFERVPWFTLWGLWSEEAKVFRSVEGDTDFGYGVTVSGDTMAARSATLTGYAVYLYERDAGGPGEWGEVARLEFDNAGPVLLLGHVLAVGMPSVEVAGEAEAGAVKLYERSSTGGWHHRGRLTASDAAAEDHFGEALAGSGGRLLVGAPRSGAPGGDTGAVYVFERDEARMWTEAGKLSASDGESGDLFGSALDMDGRTAIIGAEGDDDLGDGAGSGYVFERDPDGAWREVEKLLASDGAAGDGFGSAVAIAGEVSVAGAPAHDDAGLEDAGAAYIFERDQGGAGAWGEAARIAAAEPDAQDRFGESVATDGSSVIAGIPFEDDWRHDAGAMSIFSRTEVPGAEICIDFDGFCDGVEFTIRGNVVTGTWKNLSCDGRTQPIVGIVRDGMPSPCDDETVGKMALVCYPELDCNIFGWAWYLVFDGLDGSFDLGYDIGPRQPPPGACSSDDVNYTIVTGPCPFKPQSGGRSLASAIRERAEAVGQVQDEEP